MNIDTTRADRAGEHSASTLRGVRPAICAGLALLLQPPVANAGHPLETDDAGTQGTGVVEVEVSGLAQRPNDLTADVEVGFGVSLHTGLAERIDVGATLYWGASSESSSGWTSAMADPVLDAKWKLSRGDGAIPALALRIDYAPPQSAVGSLGHDAALLLISTWERERLAASVNTGLYGTDLETDASMLVGYLAAGGLLACAEKLHAGAELVAEWTGRGSPVLRTTSALVWQAAADRAVSLGAGVAWSEDARPGWLATLALTSAYGAD